MTRRCIQSPWWDGLWIWSGLPIGLALAGLSWGGQGWLLYVIFSTFLALDAAHLLSPVAMVAGHRELRQRAVAEPIRLIAVPALFLLLPTLFWGRLGWFGPYAYLMTKSWETWHFSSQNFGVVQLYRRLWQAPGRRWLDQLLCVVLPAITILPPFTMFLNILGVPFPQWMVPVAIAPQMLPLYIILVLVGVVQVNHWLAALALSTKVMRTQMPWWLWIGVLVLLGISGYAWTMPRAGKYHGLAALVYFNYAASFAHYYLEGEFDIFGFKVGGGIWKRGSPVMREVMA